MKHGKIIMLALIVAACTGGAAVASPKNNAGKHDAVNPAGNIYVYDGEGFGSEFIIHLYDNNRFQYYEGALSSYIGIGTWELNGDILTLTDESHFKNSFKVQADKLIWQEKSSTNFLYLKIKDGDSFSKKDVGDESLWFTIYD